MMHKALKEYFGGSNDDIERIGFWVAIFCGYVLAGLAISC
jgi:hypothetical protein